MNQSFNAGHPAQTTKLEVGQVWADRVDAERWRALQHLVDDARQFAPTYARHGRTWWAAVVGAVKNRNRHYRNDDRSTR